MILYVGGLMNKNVEIETEIGYTRNRKPKYQEFYLKD